MHSKEEKLQAFERLLDIMDQLREKCPWNAAQTMDSIRPLTEDWKSRTYTCFRKSYKPKT